MRIQKEVHFNSFIIMDDGKKLKRIIQKHSNYIILYSAGARSRIKFDDINENDFNSAKKIITRNKCSSL